MVPEYNRVLYLLYPNDLNVARNFFVKSACRYFWHKAVELNLIFYSNKTY